MFISYLSHIDLNDCNLTIYNPKYPVKTFPIWIKNLSHFWAAPISLQNIPTVQKPLCKIPVDQNPLSLSLSLCNRPMAPFIVSAQCSFHLSAQNFISFTYLQTTSSLCDTHFCATYQSLSKISISTINDNFLHRLRDLKTLNQQYISYILQKL